MVKRLVYALVLVAILLLPVLPAAAAPDNQGGGGVHFGPYVLSSGDSFSGDLVIFGEVTLKEDSELNGDLVVAGPLVIEENAVVIGEITVAGATEIGGKVDGDIFVAGSVELLETAHIIGDLSVMGELSQSEGATVEGDIVPVDERDAEGRFPFPDGIPVPIRPIVEGRAERRTPVWLRFILATLQGVVGSLVLGILALVIISLWPQQAERVGETIEEVPITAFAIGALALFLVMLASLLLVITICLSPFVLIIMAVVGVGMLLGWVSLGLLLGRRVMKGLLHQPNPSPVLATFVGTILVSFVVVLAGFWGPLRLLFLLFLFPLVGGAVLLTRFGSIPYARQGGWATPTPITPLQVPPEPPPAPPVPPAPADVAPQGPVDLDEFEDIGDEDLVEERIAEEPVVEAEDTDMVEIAEAPEAMPAPVPTEDEESLEEETPADSEESSELTSEEEPK